MATCFRFLDLGSSWNPTSSKSRTSTRAKPIQTVGLTLEKDMKHLLFCFVCEHHPPFQPTRPCFCYPCFSSLVQSRTSAPLLLALWWAYASQSRAAPITRSNESCVERDTNQFWVEPHRVEDVTDVSPVYDAQTAGKSHGHGHTWRCEHMGHKREHVMGHLWTSTLRLSGGFMKAYKHAMELGSLIIVLVVLTPWGLHANFMLDLSREQLWESSSGAGIL